MEKLEKPDILTVATGAEFDRWHWSKPELVALAKARGVPAFGGKGDLRTRLLQALRAEPPPLIREDRRAAAAGSGASGRRFNWAKARLTGKTVITEDISFGPNLRGFLKRELGPGFICHGDFMEWCRSNPGQTLEDALEAWRLLEARRNSPSFRAPIAEQNMYNQYLRDFYDANPGAPVAQARAAWMAKKQRPAAGGVVRYEVGDLDLV
ncbi:MAG: DUF6434 domain-containing protein [Alphaproteobacteria bacterium]|nr:DUF6434 domain-containing protein [Alphaproteobacteria bacterium]